MSDLSNTQFFQVEPGPQISAGDILEIVFKALKEKGYNPVNQIVGYIMSGDPTYVTSFNGARSLIMKVERDELVEELLKAYIEQSFVGIIRYENYGTLIMGSKNGRRCDQRRSSSYGSGSGDDREKKKKNKTSADLREDRGTDQKSMMWRRSSSAFRNI